MYDPLVVDTFMRTYAEIAPLALRAGQEARSILSGDSTNPEANLTSHLRQIRANASEAALLARYGQSVRRASSVKEAIDATAQCLRQIMPATVYALYVFDSKSDSLICEVALGDQQNALLGLTIPVGERVSGWVAANRQTATNSDATLDLGETARVFHPALRSTISTALANDVQLVGVLTAYAADEAAFNDGHRDVFEQVARLLLPAIAPAQTNTTANVVSFRGPKQQAGS